MVLQIIVCTDNHLSHLRTSYVTKIMMLCNFVIELLVVPATFINICNSWNYHSGFFQAPHHVAYRRFTIPRHDIYSFSYIGSQVIWCKTNFSNYTEYPIVKKLSIVILKLYVLVT